MSNPLEINVVIVDPANFGGLALRTSFVKAGVNTHVVKTFSAATKLVENTKIDAAVVEFRNDRKTTAFLQVLADKKIPCIYTAEPPDNYLPGVNAKDDIFAAVQGVLAKQGRLITNYPLVD